MDPVSALPELAGRSIVVVVLSLAAMPAVQAAPADLLSHRAAYRLSLAEAESGAGLTQVRGGLVLEWRAHCDGWLSQQRLGFVASAAEGPGFTYDIRFSSWESPDSTQLRFNVRSFDDGQMHEEFRGQATLESPGGKGVARYTAPAGTELDLPAGTLFPTSHIQALIASAQAGTRFVTHEVFDGSGPDGLTRVTAVIGAPRTIPLVAGAGEAHGWPVSLAYYNLAGQDALPQFEIAFDLTDQGLLQNISLDYGDFTLSAQLERLETFTEPSCG